MTDTTEIDLVKYMEPLIAGLFAVRGDILSADEQRTAAEAIVRCLPESIKDAVENEALRTQVSVMREALEEVREYFDQRADADQPAGCAAPIPNEEMRLLVTVDAALALSSNQEAN